MGKGTIMIELTVGICMVTYKRPKQLIKALSWIRERTMYENYKLYIIIDYEDNDATLKELSSSPFYEENVEMFPSRVECVKATNRCYSIGDEPYFVWLSDDMEVEKEWLKEAMKCMQTFPNAEGLVTFKDGIQNGRNACAGLISRNYIKTMLNGIFYNEIYKHFSADTELYEKSKSLGRIKYCPTSVVWHNHWGGEGKHKSQQDSIYTDSRHLFNKDGTTFARRIKENFNSR